VGLTAHPPSSAEVKERGELYLLLPVWALVAGYKGELHVSSFFCFVNCNSPERFYWEK